MIFLNIMYLLLGLGEYNLFNFFLLILVKQRIWILWSYSQIIYMDNLVDVNIYNYKKIMRIENIGFGIKMSFYWKSVKVIFFFLSIYFYK